jgi:hypothetical protein
MSQIVRHDPSPILSRAVEYNGMVFVAGLTADDYSLDIKGQTEQVLRKIDKYLAAAGTNKSRLLSALIYVSDERGLDSVDRQEQPALPRVRPGGSGFTENAGRDRRHGSQGLNGSHGHHAPRDDRGVHRFGEDYGSYAVFAGRQTTDFTGQFALE